MKFETIGQRLKTLRTLAKLSQAELAARVGVRQCVYSKWERDERPVPPALVAPLAAALDVDVRVLSEVNARGPVLGRPVLPALLRSRQKCTPSAPPYEVKGTVEEVCAINETAHDVCRRASSLLNRCDLGLVEKSFPRDSKWELFIMFHVLAEEAYPSQLTFGQQKCPLLTVPCRGSLRLDQHTKHHCLVVERASCLFVLTPQVWVVSPTQGEWYRLDFLCGVFGSDGRARFADLEFDTYEHDTDYDRRRARGICAPRLRTTARQVCRPEFGRDLLERLEALLDQPEPDYDRR